MASGDAAKRVVGVALCGFGRAGQIHFGGLRHNYDCKLKYIIDRVELPGVLEAITNTLDKYHVTDVRPVSVEDFDKASASQLSENACSLCKFPLARLH